MRKRLKKASIKKKLTTKKPAKKILLKSVDSLFPARSKDTIVRANVDGTFSIVHLEEDDSFFTVVGLATEVWKRIDGKKSLAEIKNAVIKKFMPPEAQFQRDANKFVLKLKDENLIELRRSPQKDKK